MTREHHPTTVDPHEAIEGTVERSAVLIVGAGQNTAHMQEALARVAANHETEVHFSEVSEPQLEVSADRLHRIDTEEGRESLRRLIGSGAVRAAYLSVVPGLHKDLLEEYLGHATDGNLDMIVVPKPFAQNVVEMRAMRAMTRAAQTRRQKDNPDYDPTTNPLVYIHEHYNEKGAWKELRGRLPDVAARLGRLESVAIDIQEARTAEDEGRVEAFRGGALEDLGPHVISLGLGVQSAINRTDRYSIPDRSQTSIERFRYEDSELPDGVETSFIVRGQTTIDDNQTHTAHDLDFTWRGGKGLVDHKAARLTFVHPDTGEYSTIIVDLGANMLSVPESVSDLFPKTEFEDNGYGDVVEAGLSGGDPSLSFQSLSEAAVVTKMQAALASKGRRRPPRMHSRGSTLRRLARTR